MLRMNALAKTVTEGAEPPKTPPLVALIAKQLGVDPATLNIEKIKADIVEYGAAISSAVGQVNDRLALIDARLSMIESNQAVILAKLCDGSEAITERMLTDTAARDDAAEAAPEAAPRL